MRSHVTFAALSACAAASSLHTLAPSTTLRAGGGILPNNTLTHFCVITAFDDIEATLAMYGTLFGVTPPTPSIAGGNTSNGTYVIDGVPQPLSGTTKIAFMNLNNDTRMEFLAGDPATPSWWRDVYLDKGKEIHHMGYAIGTAPVWPVVEAFTAAGFGSAVQWGRWGEEDTPGGGCYVYLDSQLTLGVTTEILSADSGCDSLPAPP